MKSAMQFAFIVVCALACFAIVWGGFCAYPDGYLRGIEHARQMTVSVDEKIARLRSSLNAHEARIHALERAYDELTKTNNGSPVGDVFPEPNDPENCR